MSARAVRKQEMGHGLEKPQGLGALLKDPGSIPSTYMAAHNHIISAVCVHQVCMWHIDIYVGKKPLNMKIKFKTKHNLQGPTPIPTSSSEVLPP